MKSKTHYNTTYKHTRQYVSVFDYN